MKTFSQIASSNFTSTTIQEKEEQNQQYHSNFSKYSPTHRIQKKLNIVNPKTLINSPESLVYLGSTKSLKENEERQYLKQNLVTFRNQYERENTEFENNQSFTQGQSNNYNGTLSSQVTQPAQLNALQVQPQQVISINQGNSQFMVIATGCIFFLLLILLSFMIFKSNSDNVSSMQAYNLTQAEYYDIKAMFNQQYTSYSDILFQKLSTILHQYSEVQQKLDTLQVSQDDQNKQLIAQNLSLSQFKQEQQNQLMFYQQHQNHTIEMLNFAQKELKDFKKKSNHTELMINWSKKMDENWKFYQQQMSDLIKVEVKIQFQKFTQKMEGILEYKSQEQKQLIMSQMQQIEHSIPQILNQGASDDQKNSVELINKINLDISLLSGKIESLQQNNKDESLTQTNKINSLDQQINQLIDIQKENFKTILQEQSNNNSQMMFNFTQSLNDSINQKLTDFALQQRKNYELFGNKTIHDNIQIRGIEENRINDQIQQYLKEEMPQQFQSLSDSLKTMQSTFEKTQKIQYQSLQQQISQITTNISSNHEQNDKLFSAINKIKNEAEIQNNKMQNHFDQIAENQITLNNNLQMVQMIEPVEQWMKSIEDKMNIVSSQQSIVNNINQQLQEILNENLIQKSDKLSFQKQINDQFNKIHDEMKILNAKLSEIKAEQEQQIQQGQQLNQGQQQIQQIDSSISETSAQDFEILQKQISLLEYKLFQSIQQISEQIKESQQSNQKQNEILEEKQFKNQDNNNNQIKDQVKNKSKYSEIQIYQNGELKQFNFNTTQITYDYQETKYLSCEYSDDKLRFKLSPNQKNRFSQSREISGLNQISQIRVVQNGSGLKRMQFKFNDLNGQENSDQQLRDLDCGRDKTNENNSVEIFNSKNSTLIDIKELGNTLYFTFRNNLNC